MGYASKSRSRASITKIIFSNRERKKQLILLAMTKGRRNLRKNLNQIIVTKTLSKPDSLYKIAF